MRPHRRKDKSRAPGKMLHPTPSLPIQPENRHFGQSNMPPRFGPGAGPQLNPAHGNMFITPPVQFQPPMYQQSPLSPTAQDAEVIRRANILLEAVKDVWGDSSSEADSSDDEEATAPTSVSSRVSSFENLHQPINATGTVLPSVETPPVRLPSAVSNSEHASIKMANIINQSEPPHRRKRSPTEGPPGQSEHVVKRPKSPHAVSIGPSDSQNPSGHNNVNAQQIPSPHVPIYLAPASTAPTRPPRQGHIMKFDTNKGVAKLPTPPSEPSPTQVPSVPEPPTRQGTVITQPDKSFTRFNTNPGPVKVMPGVPQYLPTPHPVLASKPPTSRNFSLHPPPPTAFPPPVMGSFKPINGIGYLPSNRRQQRYSSVPTMADPRNKRQSLPPVLPKNGSVVQTDRHTPPTFQQAPHVPPKNGTVVKLNDPGPAKEHAPREKPPKNGTLIDFGKPAKPYQSASRRKKG